MDDSNSTTTNHDGTELLVFSILNVICFITSLIGLCGNAFIIYVYCRTPKIRDATMTFILNLSVADFCTLVVICFYEISLFLDLQYRYNSFFGCISVELFFNWFTFASQFFISAATFDRFVAICYCTSYQRIMSNRMVKVLLVGSWIMAIFLAGLPLYTDDNRFHVYNCLYHLILPDEVYITYSSTLMVLMFLSLSFQIKILIKAWAIYRKSNFETEASTAKRKSVRNGKLMGTVTIMFIMCWLPYNIVQLQFGSRGLTLNNYLLGITFYLGMLNSILNPFIYAKQRRDFQKESKKILGRIICRRQNPESQQPQSSREDNVCTRVKTVNGVTGTHTTGLAVLSSHQRKLSKLQFSTSSDMTASTSRSNNEQYSAWTCEHPLQIVGSTDQSQYRCTTKRVNETTGSITVKNRRPNILKVIDIEHEEGESI